MTESYLWLINHCGDTFSLGTGHFRFSQLPNTYDDVVTVKRVAASHWCAWAVGHNHRPYLYVLSSDVPIRIPETTYENQRWNPFHGFSKKSLLPSDRHAWSNENGTVERPKESVRLPSAHWEWDGDWMIDDNLRGEVVELGGWQYALDFPSMYTPEQHWNSFVRRRKWIHFRRFAAYDCWATISDMETVEKSECFIDISVGGFLLPSQPDGFLCVWAVMNSGSVYVRTEVHRENPEGSSWQSISLGEHHGIINISVGATNLVWGVTWDGHALVRTHVSRRNVYGVGWASVECPSDSTHLMQVAVGRNAVWALSRDFKVWFRKGTCGDDTFWNEASAVGSVWVEMVGEMSQIALSSNDQVFAIDATGLNVFFRTSVSRQDLTGKTWQKVTLREDLSQFKDLGLLNEGEEFCEIHDSSQGLSESTSCSSFSLSTSSTPVNINDDHLGGADVPWTPLQPSLSSETSPMQPWVNSLPPAWGLSDATEEETNKLLSTQTCGDFLMATQSSAQESNTFSRSPSLPSLTAMERKTPEEDSSLQTDGRVSSVSELSLTNSQPHSSKTVSPASSTGTVQVGLTESLTSQTLKDNGEFSTAPGLTHQESLQSHANAKIHDESYGLTSGENSPAQRGNFSDQEDRVKSKSQAAHEEKTVTNALKNNTEENKLEKGADLASQTVTDLTEVDGHFKFLRESNSVNIDTVSNSSAAAESTKSNTQYVQSPSCSYKADGVQKIQINHKIASSDNLSVAPYNSKVMPADQQSKSAHSDLVTAKSFSHSESVNLIKSDGMCEESHKQTQDNPQAQSPTVIVSPVEEKNYDKKRNIKSRKHSNNLKKPEVEDQEDTIVFKPVRKKKEKNRSKTSGTFSVDHGGLGEFSDHPPEPVTGQRNYQEMFHVQSADISSRHSNDPCVDGDFLKTSTDVTDSYKICDSPKEELSEHSKYVAGHGNSFSPSNIAHSLAESEAKAQGSGLNSIPETVDGYEKMAHKSSYKTDEVQDNFQTDAQQDSCPEDAQPSSIKLTNSNMPKHFVDKVDFNDFDKNGVCNNLEKKLVEVALSKLQEKKQIDISAVNLDSNNKSCEDITNNVNSESNGHQNVISVSPETGELTKSIARLSDSKKKQPLKNNTDEWCNMIKLTPSVKKAAPPGAVDFKVIADPQSQAGDSDLESDEIADFVTDLISEEDEKEEETMVSKDVEVDVDQNKDEIDCCEKEIEVPDSSARWSVDSSYSVQSVRTSSVSSAGSISSGGRHFPMVRRTSGSVHSSSVPSSLSLRTTTLYRQMPSPASVSSSTAVDVDTNADSFPAPAVGAAQPRLCWRWLAATNCVIDDPSKVEWLSKSEDDKGPKKTKAKIPKQLRQKLLLQILARNRRELAEFKSLESAVERSTWVHKANMEMFLYGRSSRWVKCNIELEQGIGVKEEGAFTVHYTHHRQQRHTQVNLSDMTCVKMSSDPDMPTSFSVYTTNLNLTEQPIRLRASSEKEASEWLSYLSCARASAWDLNRPVKPGAIWSCCFNGDVLVSPSPLIDERPYARCWGQHGGHMAMVETSPCGVTWALGFDRMPHVYNGGFGGAVGTGRNDMSDSTHQVTDSHRVHVYENQKWFPLVGWCNKGVFHHNIHWVTSSGQFVNSRDQVKLPSSKWNWISDWTVDFSTSGGVDPNGWQYSNNLNGSFHRSRHIRDNYRRRRWLRRCRISVMGPWISAGSLMLSDLSIQIDPVESTSDPVIMWAVAANGDVLCRIGVTWSYPLGQSWVHISTDLDKPFTSISVGGQGKVWGVAADGSAWYRVGVTPTNPAGKWWLQVVPPPPGNYRLRQVSAGALAVWAVDTGDNLWRRENITPTFPEGTGWQSVANKVKRVSVGPQDQVWIVADTHFQKSRQAPGVIYLRMGICDECPAGKQWQRVIGSGWAYVSVRGMSAHLQQLDSSTEDSLK